MTATAWKARLKTASTKRDQTWQDDREDFRCLGISVSLPEEGDYDPDLTVVTQRPEVEELYDARIAVEGLPAFPSLYKRAPGCRFDWEERTFTWGKDVQSEMPYPQSTDEELGTAAHRIATSERGELGILKLTAESGGGAPLLEEKIRRNTTPQ